MQVSVLFLYLKDTLLMSGIGCVQGKRRQQMLTYYLQFKYTIDALIAIIDQLQDRKAAAAALCESVG